MVAEESREMVLEPIMRAVAESARDIGVPDIVIAPPGVSVWEPMMYWDALLAVAVWKPIVRIGRSVGPATRFRVLVSMAMSDWAIGDVIMT